MSRETYRYVVVADDFGITDASNRGVARAVNAGVLDHVSLMLKRPASREAVKIAQTWTDVTVGLHVDVEDIFGLTEEFWMGAHHPKAGERLGDARLIQKVLEASRVEIEEFLGLGFPPTFLNSHNHVHFVPEVFFDFTELASEYGFSSVRFSPIDPLFTHSDIPMPQTQLDRMKEKLERMHLAHTDRYFITLFRFFPPALKPGTTEIVVHPREGTGDIYELDLVKLLSWGAYYRSVECEETVL
ncbi:MAG: ChbG/HpnK family deacetylase [Deltaproteobacteria bacterium]|nr:ChbG/HpnK family deacetylase [Candidatus Zymogenaceae bacterium]